jgi:hypothetical protein
MLRRIVGSAAFLTLVSTPVQASAAEDAAALDSCVLVVSGAGSKAGNQQVTDFWHQVNTSIAKALLEQLAADKVPVRSEVIPAAASDEDVPGKIALALARDRCGQLLQFNHQLGGGSGPGAFFAFQASLFGVEETKGGFKIGKEAFSKNYRYALNEEVLKTFSISEMATRLGSELKAAGVLPAASGEPAKPVP